MGKKLLEIGGIQNLDNNDLEKTEGGALWQYFTVYILAEIALNPEAHWEAFKRGFNKGNS